MGRGCVMSLPPNDLGSLFTRFLDEIGDQLMGVRNSSLAHVAIDLSGPDDRDTYVSLGTVVGVGPEWALFHDEWGKVVLDGFGIPALRMADAISWRGPFEEKSREWGDQRDRMRGDLLESAAKTIRKHLRRASATYDATKF